MKFKIVRSKFLDCLKNVQNVVSAKGTLPILQNVKIEVFDNKIRMTTTDLDLSAISEWECEVVEPGSTTLPVKLLFNSISKAVECVIEVSSDETHHATISAGRAKFKITGLDDKDFPRLPEDKQGSVYKLDQATFKEMLRKVAYAASQDDTRRTLKGVLMSFKDGKLTMVATDGRRLALVEKEVEYPKADEKDIVLPSKAVQELQRSLIGEGQIEISLCGSQIKFSYDSVVLFSKMIEDVYPNYKQVIPKEQYESIYFDRQQLMEALDRTSVMSMDDAHSTKLSFSDGLLTISSAAGDKGEVKDEVPIKYVGETIEIVFNPSYMIDALKVIDDDEVSINLKDGHSPAVIHCSIPFLYVLMPLRIS